MSYDTVSDLAVLRVESDSPLPTAKLGGWQPKLGGWHRGGQAVRGPEEQLPRSCAAVGKTCGHGCSWGGEIVCVCLLRLSAHCPPTWRACRPLGQPASGGVGGGAGQPAAPAEQRDSRHREVRWACKAPHLCASALLILAFSATATQARTCSIYSIHAFWMHSMAACAGTIHPALPFPALPCPAAAWTAKRLSWAWRELAPTTSKQMPPSTRRARKGCYERGLMGSALLRCLQPISHAMRCLQPRSHVAPSGTPALIGLLSLLMCFTAGQLGRAATKLAGRGGGHFSDEGGCGRQVSLLDCDASGTIGQGGEHFSQRLRQVSCFCWL